MGKKQITVLSALGITGVWLSVALFVMSKHEIWLDEAQHWLLARDSNSLGELYRNMKYEGHPPLWNVLLFVLSAFSDSPAIMQYAHLVFAGATVFLIVRFAPFPLWVKVVLPFTYFFGYEYAIIARNYAPAVFFIVLACVMAKDSEKNLIRISVALAIATCFHVYAGVVGFVLLGYFIYQLSKNGKSRSAGWKPMIILGVSGLIASWFLWRIPSDHYLFMYRQEVFTLNRIGAGLLLPFSSLIHFPVVNEPFWWNSNIFLQGSDVSKGIIGVIFWLIPVAVFRNNRPVLLVYLPGIMILSLALVFTPSFIAVRHAGFTALLFFVCVWIGGETVTNTKLSKGILGAFIGIQFCSWCFTAYKECTQPFSHGKNVAVFIQKEFPELKVGVYPAYVGPPVSAYLNEKLFYGKYDTEKSFADWSSRGMITDRTVFVSGCRDYMKQEGLDSMIIVSHTGLEGFEIEAEGLEQLNIFNGAAVHAENYKVYLLTNE